MNPQTIDPLAISESVWDDLLTNIEARQVIPIIGADLLQVDVNGVKQGLDQYLANSLLRVYQQLDPRVGQLADESLSLNRVVCLLREAIPENKNKPYAKVDRLLKELVCEVPEPLRKLAEITDFNLFVTTTFDGLLERALNEVRYAGRTDTHSVVYYPQEAQDLELGRDGQVTHPSLVYYLLGKSVPTAKWVICDEDLLEFVSALQSESRGPRNLLGQLKEKHLLILGASFPDWLGRFFLRTARQGRLTSIEDRLQILADNKTQNDSDLVFFLKHFSMGTKILPAGGAEDFVDELYRRWRERNPESSTSGGMSAPPSRDMPAGAVFISYAHEDLAAAQSIKRALDAAHIPAWFDMEQLMGGDRFEHKIRTNINQCCCFVPLLSKTVETRTHDAYFRREWIWAINRAETMSHNVPFIVPVLVDELRKHNFKEVDPELIDGRTNYRLTGGAATPEFVERIRELHQAWMHRTSRATRPLEL